MTTRSTRALLAATAIAVALPGLSTEAAAATYSARTSSNVNLPAGGFQLVTVLTVRGVPAGRWLVQSKLSAVNFGNPDFVRCNLFAGASSVDGSTTYVGSPSPVVAMIVNQATLNLGAARTVTLQCQHDTSVTADSPVPYIDAGAAMVISPIAP